jgi:hypothetical protein
VKNGALRCVRGTPRFTDPSFPVPILTQQHCKQENGETSMKLGAAIAEIMKREGIEILCGYPVNHLIEFAANADIRPIMVRQNVAMVGTARRARLCPPFCNGPRLVNPFSLSVRRGLASVRGRREAAT